MSGNFESQMPTHPDNMNNNGSAINFLHFNHAFKKVNSFFGNVDPKTPVQFYKYHLYDLLKPLWLELRVLGVLPLEKTTEHGSTVFRRTCAAMLYSVTFYVVVGIYIVYIGMVKVKELQALKPNQFDEVVNAYLFLVYLLPHIVIPLCHWKMAGQICCFMNDWTTFQVHFFQITHNVMPLKEGSKNVKVMAVLVPVLSIVAIIADWSMMPEFKVWEICGYSYTTTLVHLHVVLWYCTCCSVAACGRHLVHLLYQGTQNGRHVSNYCSLWQDLSRLSRKIGESFCYIYGLIIIIWFSTMTLSLYGGLTGILDHGCGLREFGLIVNATFCTFILFLICDAGEKLSDELGPKFLENLRSLNVVVNRDVKQECSTMLLMINNNLIISNGPVFITLDVFRYDVAMTAPVINLGGYVSLNRNLLLNLMATMVSQMIILLQFRIGAKPDNVPQTVVFNETCKLICKEQ